MMNSIASRFLSVFGSLLEASVTNVPGPFGRVLRGRFWRRRLKHMGKGVKIDVGVRILNPQFISIGDNTWIDNYVIILAGSPKEGDGPLRLKENSDFTGLVGEVTIGANVHIANFVVIQGHGGLEIGDNTGIASGSMLYSMSHHHSNLVDRSDSRKYDFSPMVPRSNQSLIAAPVVVGKSSAVGLNSIILPGVTVGSGSWVGSGSVVGKSVLENALVAGNPAQVVKTELHPGWDPDKSNEVAEENSH